MRIPKSQGRVRASRGNVFPVTAHRDGNRSAGMPEHGNCEIALLSIPYPSFPVCTYGNELATIATNDHAFDGARMMQIEAERAQCRH